MKRTRMNRGTRRMGQRAAERRAAGGPLVVGRETTGPEWEERKRALWQRGAGRCERRGVGPGDCAAFMEDPHHIVKRSAGGTDDLDNLAGLCRDCHDWTDEAPEGHRGALRVAWDATLGRPVFHVEQHDEVPKAPAKTWNRLKAGVAPLRGGGAQAEIRTPRGAHGPLCQCVGCRARPSSPA